MSALDAVDGSDGPALKMRNKILSDGASRGGAVALLVDRAHRHCAPKWQRIPRCPSFRQGFAERGNKFIGLGETLARSSGEAQPRAAIFFRRGKSLAVFHPREFAVIERKPKRIAESRKRSLGRVGFGSFERKLMGLAWRRGLGFATATAFSGDRDGASPDGDAHLGDVGCGIVVVRSI